MLGKSSFNKLFLLCYYCLISCLLVRSNISYFLSIFFLIDGDWIFNVASFRDFNGVILTLSVKFLHE